MDLNEILFNPLLEAAQPLIEIAPRLLAFVAVIVVGLVLSYLVKRLVTFIAKLLSFDMLSYRIGLTSLLSRIWFDRTPAETVGRLAYWLVLFFHLLFGVSVLHIQTLNELAVRTMAWVPLLVVSLAVFAAGYFLAKFLGTAALIALVNAQYRSASLIALLVRIAVMIFFVAIAAEQLGIGSNIIAASFAILLGGAVLALAIAFGLGGREFAKEILERKLSSLEEKTPGSDENH